MIKNYIIAGHKPKNKMNKTELNFYKTFLEPLIFNKEILYCYFNKIKFEIGELTCNYLPDFFIIYSDLSVKIFEIKGGYITDDAKIKFKVACKEYPLFKWECWQWKNKIWTKIMEN
jgi:hypothetical protein